MKWRVTALSGMAEQTGLEPVHRLNGERISNPLQYLLCLLFRIAGLSRLSCCLVCLCIKFRGREVAAWTYSHPFPCRFQG